MRSEILSVSSKNLSASANTLVFCDSSDYIYTMIPISKLVKIALLTSLILVSVLVIAPHVVMTYSFSGAQFFKSLAAVVVFILMLWFINILLLFVTSRYTNFTGSSIVRYLMSYLLCLLTVWLARDLINSFVHDQRRAPAHLYAVFTMSFILNSVVLIIQDLFVLREKKTNIELENAGLKMKNVEATNLQLKEQIHPHFLFNSLSTLKVLIRQDAEQAETYLTRLSDVLRASLASTTTNIIRLDEELKLCSDYLEMQQIRFGDALTYTVAIPEAVRESSYLPIFSLLPLLENAIKHNKFTADAPLKISIRYANGEIITSNNIAKRELANPSTGLGLKNLSERYRLLSGDSITIVNDGNNFSVSIKLLPGESSDHRR